MNNNKFFLICVYLLLVTSLGAQTKSEFADHLMLDRDYFRAISIYKELAFFSRNQDSTIFFLSQIGKAYRLSKKFDLSVQTYSYILNSHKLTPHQSNNLYTNLALNYIDMNIPQQALPFLIKAIHIDTTEFNMFCMGLAKAKLGEWEEAKKHFDITSLKPPASSLDSISRILSQKVILGPNIQTKSPIVAASLSTIFPGAGQMYSGHYIDAIQAFGFVSAFTFTSILAYKYEKNFRSNYLYTGVSISITALFHIANIIGAERTAVYFNQRQRELFFDDINNSVSKIVFPASIY